MYISMKNNLDMGGITRDFKTRVHYKRNSIFIPAASRCDSKPSSGLSNGVKIPVHRMVVPGPVI